MQYPMYDLDVWTYMYTHTTDPKKLTLLNVIGSGTFGTVYRACWRGTIVAAKVIPLQCEVTSKEVELLKCLLDHSLLAIVTMMDLYLYIG